MFRQLPDHNWSINAMWKDSRNGGKEHGKPCLLTKSIDWMKNPALTNSWGDVVFWVKTNGRKLAVNSLHAWWKMVQADICWAEGELMKMVLLTSVGQRLNRVAHLPLLSKREREGCGFRNPLLSKKETGSERLATCATSDKTFHSWYLSLPQYISLASGFQISMQIIGGKTIQFGNVSGHWKQPI